MLHSLPAKYFFYLFIFFSAYTPSGLNLIEQDMHQDLQNSKQSKEKHQVTAKCKQFCIFIHLLTYFAVKISMWNSPHTLWPDKHTTHILADSKSTFGKAGMEWHINIQVQLQSKNVYLMLICRDVQEIYKYQNSVTLYITVFMLQCKIN